MRIKNIGKWTAWEALDAAEAAIIPEEQQGSLDLPRFDDGVAESGSRSELAQSLEESQSALSCALR